MTLAVSISIWFIAIRDPLWPDETGSYWMIGAGFSKILSRQIITFPAYSYILWLSTKIIGSSEIALRVPSVAAMLAAAYLLFRAAGELFDREFAIIATIIFCLNPIVIFASVDVRPYAFAALATNVAILILVRLRRCDSTWLAALFGLSAACIVWFHFLFAAILPALVLCFFAIKICDRKTLWRQFGVALGAFALAFLPVIPVLQYLFATGKTHVIDQAPNLLDLVRILAPSILLAVFCVTVPVVLFVSTFSRRQRDAQNHFEGRLLLFCVSLAIIPVFILYGVSAETSLHFFKESHHELAGVPGIALCWALAVRRFDSRTMRLVFCAVFATASAFQYFSYSIESERKDYTWKYALEFVQQNASVDDASVLVCSDFVESEYASIPLDSAKDSPFFPQLSYYKLSVPVVPLPESLNDEAIRNGSRFVQEAARKHERFLAVAYMRSYRTLDWLAERAAATHTVRILKVFRYFKVVEFAPRAELNSLRSPQ